MRAHSLRALSGGSSWRELARTSENGTKFRQSCECRWHLIVPSVTPSLFTISLLESPSPTKVTTCCSWSLNSENGSAIANKQKGCQTQRPLVVPMCLFGLSRQKGSDTCRHVGATADQYQRAAEETKQLAAKATDSCERVQLLRLAAQWQRLAHYKARLESTPRHNQIDPLGAAGSGGRAW